MSIAGGSLIPYGLPCLRELFRFLISLTNPHDRHNTDTMMHMGLQLLTVALESGHVVNYQSLLVLVKDELCRHLLQVPEDEKDATCWIVTLHFSPAFHFSICWQSLGNFISPQHILSSFFLWQCRQTENVDFELPSHNRSIQYTSICVFSIKTAFLHIWL